MPAGWTIRSGVTDGEWLSLWHRAPGATPFVHPNWVHAAAGILSTGPVLVLATYEGSTLRAVWPLTRTWWRGLQQVGTGPADTLGPLADQEMPHAAFEEMLQLGVECLRPAVVDLHELPVAYAGTTPVPEGFRRTLDLRPGYDAVRSRWSASLRQDVRPKAGLNVTWQSDAYEEFRRLHNERWRRRGLPGAFRGRRDRFHRRFAASGLATFGVLKQGGDTVGVIYLLETAQCTYFYQLGIRADAKGLSPGSRLIDAALQRSITRGAQTFDFLRGDEPYKRRWKPDGFVASYRRIENVAPRLGRWVAAGLGHWHNGEARLRARLESGG